MISVKPFSAELMKTILSSVDDYMRQHPGPSYAAFDVDGTLWDSDVGENFFQYQIDHCDLPALKGINDPWSQYWSLKKKHPPDAYLWLARICAGYDISEVEEWAQKAIQKFPLQVFDSQKQLIAELLNRGVRVYCVSASVKWAVAAAMPLVGLKSEDALGVATQVAAGQVTVAPDGPVTWREGKATALLAQTQNTRPLFCSGNTSGDIHLLHLAQAKALAVQTQTSDSKHEVLYKDEQHLLRLAKQNHWLTHAFREEQEN